MLETEVEVEVVEVVETEAPFRLPFRLKTLERKEFMIPNWCKVFSKDKLMVFWFKK